VAPKTIDELVKKIDQIPTLPMISQQIMQLLDDKDASFKEIADLIEKDQALAVKILKVANSAFYGSFSQISSIDFALMKLGLGEVRSILYAFSVHHFFSQQESEGFDRTGFWKHSMICSQVARYLGQHFNIQKDDTLFLSGLIHDLGKIVFDQYFHEDFIRIVDHINTQHDSFSSAEKDIIGFTHYQVSAKLLQQWRFPKKVIMQVFFHHAPWNDNNYQTGSIIIYLANILTKIAGFPCLPSERELDPAQFADSKEMEFIIKSGFDLNHQILDNLVQHIQDIICNEGENTLGLF